VEGQATRGVLSRLSPPSERLGHIHRGRQGSSTTRSRRSSTGSRWNGTCATPGCRAPKARRCRWSSKSGSPTCGAIRKRVPGISRSVARCKPQRVGRRGRTNRRTSPRAGYSQARGARGSIDGGDRGTLGEQGGGTLGQTGSTPGRGERGATSEKLEALHRQRKLGRALHTGSVHGGSALANSGQRAEGPVARAGPCSAGLPRRRGAK